MWGEADIDVREGQDRGTECYASEGLVAAVVSWALCLFKSMEGVK